MSTTVYKKKANGEIVPIKLSIWDAFHGCPNPKPRKPKPCPCCGTIHEATNTAKQQMARDECIRKGGTGLPAKAIEDGKPGNEENGKADDGKPGNDENGKADDDKEKKGGDGTKANTHSGRPIEVYTAEDDAKIIELKKINTPWKDILKAIGKESPSQLKEHWKKNLEAKVSIEKPEEQKEDGDKEQDDKKAKANKNKAEGLAKQDAAKKEKETKGENEGKGKKDKGKGKAKQDTKAADSKPSDNAVKSWADRYDKQKWMAVASKHYDKTGQRITPEMARKMAEAK